MSVNLGGLQADLMGGLGGGDPIKQSKYFFGVLLTEAEVRHRLVPRRSQREDTYEVDQGVARGAP